MVGGIGGMYPSSSSIRGSISSSNGIIVIVMVMVVWQVVWSGSLVMVMVVVNGGQWSVVVSGLAGLVIGNGNE